MFVKIRTMKNLFLLTFTLVLFWGCEKENNNPSPINSGYLCDGNECTNSSNASSYNSIEECEENCGLNNDTESIEIIYNIHESLPDIWITEFYLIIDNLISTIPSFMTDLDNLTIYAWNGGVEDPYEGIEGGSYLSGSPEGLSLVLEIPELEFNFNSMHQYSVIAHEYFHVYQLSINESMRENNFDIMWLIEGGAATFESIYIQDFYDYNYFVDAQNNISNLVHSEADIFETYNTMDINYSSCVFMTLVLAKELMINGHSEEEAFRMILKDFMKLSASNQNWHIIFEELFNFTVADFYDVLVSYPLDINQVVPNEALSVEQIFI
tara:strand:- start:64 stop:1035 length:972 start_codon:yes stop_codon:yes gene_type:complete